MNPVWNAPSNPLDPSHFDAVRRPLLEASTLPPWCYSSAAFYDREIRQVFGKAWNFVGHVDQLPAPGTYVTFDFLGVPIALVRDKDGEIRAFANSCRHRGAKLLDGAGEAAAIRCPYHSWTYDLTGRLRGAPQMEDTAGFSLGDHALDQFQVGIWGGFIFVCLDPAAPALLEFLGELPELLQSYALDDMHLVRLKSWDVGCNWKIYVENAMESYHVPTVHAKTIQLQRRDINPPLHGERGQWCGLYTRHQGSRALEVGDTGFPHIGSLAGGAAEGTYYILIYPTTMLALTYDCMWWLEVYPRGPERCLVRSGACFPKSTVARADFDEVVQRYYKRWDKSIPEDNVVSELQQQGLSSPFARTGRFSRMEPLVHSLANWLLDRVEARGA
jgi:phenylpropionate dioxygenase-like ring-hydroxylating dioxygenase large terminal subunit